MNSKNFLYSTLSIGILIFSFDKLYKLWKSNQDEIIQQQQSIEKRKQEDKFYIIEYQREFQAFLDSEKKMLQEVQLNNTIKDLENRMVHDGYTYAEVGAIRNQALSLLHQKG